MSKLAPIVKQQVTTINRLVDYINDIKPYHTKILDTRVTFVIREAVHVNVSDEIQSTIDMILNTPIAYDENIIASKESFSLHGFGATGFGAPSGIDYTLANGANGMNTIVSGINEYLIIDTTRTVVYGLDFTVSPDDVLDDSSSVVLPKLRATRPPIAEGLFLQPEIAPDKTFGSLLSSTLSKAEYVSLLNKSGILLDEMFSQI